MTYSELKVQEAALLSSNRSSLKEYGRAYQEIIKRYSHSSTAWLSDEVLLSDIAVKYIADLKKDLRFADDKSIIKRIQGAAKLIIHEFVSHDFLYGYLANMKERPTTFEEARKVLEPTYFYRKIRPETLTQVLSELNAF